MQDTEVAEKEYEDGRDDPAVHTADIGKRITVFRSGSSRPSGAGGGKRFYPGSVQRDGNVLFQELEDH